MTQDSALAARGERRAGYPTGFRRLTPGLLQADPLAEGFAGLPDGVTMHGQLLAAFKAAAPRLGLSSRLVHAVDWLFRFTMPQDWSGGGRPVVWPSASMQQEALGLSPTRVKAINRALIEAGLITMKDSPNGKRYGKRDPKGRIAEAYGFDLSPIAARHAEFLELAEAARAEREAMRRLRRRATIARNGIAQIRETAAEYGFHGEEWAVLARETHSLAVALRKIELPEVLEPGVESLERHQRVARERLEVLLAGLTPKASEPVNPDPKGAGNGPHQYTYKPNLDSDQNTVIARNGRGSAGGGGGASTPALERRAPPERGRVLKLRPDELTRLAPRLTLYLARPDPTWPEVVDAAAFLRSDLYVSHSLWGEACLAMGREQAAIAVAIVSTKDPAHFRTTAGGYFHGMVMKAKTGDLNLDRTLWALRRARDPRPAGQPRGGAGRAGEARPASRPWQ
jgi:replication initiation protein RepC